MVTKVVKNNITYIISIIQSAYLYGMCIIFQQQYMIFYRFFLIFAFIKNKFMKKICICIVLILSVAINPIMAQKKKKANVQPVVQLSEEELIKQERLEQMTDATQKIMFIDSIVTDKENFLEKYALSPEAGTLCRNNDMFNTNNQKDASLHINELGNKCYFSDRNTDGKMTLYTSDKLGKQWTEPYALVGLSDNDDFEQLNYPYIMADGTTLYFAAQGNESIGGYDIFETRYDAGTGTFLKPENIGMPFNSTANDYMYVIDETEGIGWFATDRNQPEGKVCIYIFIIPETRQVYSTGNYTNEQIKKFASIASISDTWGKGNERDIAFKKLQNITNRKDKKEDFTNKISFVINDNITYTDISEFKSSENRKKFAQLQELKELAEILSDKTEKARTQYANANKSVRKQLSADILKNEKELEALEIQIRQMEKNIRNNENILLNQK